MDVDEIELVALALVEEFKIQHDAIMKGNHRINNKSVVRGMKLFRILRDSGNMEELLKQIDSSSVAVRAYVAVYCLPINEELCLQVLKEIRDTSDNILGLQTEHAIKHWENGTYQIWDG